jgi:hypothetical protein
MAQPIREIDQLSCPHFADQASAIIDLASWSTLRSFNKSRSCGTDFPPSPMSDACRRTVRGHRSLGLAREWKMAVPDYLCRWRDRSWRSSMVIAKIFLQNEWFYSAIKRAHTSRYLCALSSGRYSLMKSMNARSLGVICLPDGHSSRKVFCSVVYSSRTVTNAPLSRAARTENSDM